MNRKKFLLVIIGCVYLLMPSNTEAELVSIQQLLSQVEASPGSIDKEILEAIALTSYEVLLNIPFDGLENHRAEIQALLSLRNTLGTYTGLSERFLSLRMQEAIDRMLLVEVSRRAMHRIGKTVTPPYQIHSITPETVFELLEKNSFEEQRQIEYIRRLHGQFASFCRSKNFSVEDFLNCTVMMAFPQEWKTSIKSMQLALHLFSEKENMKTVEDGLFISVLTALDQAKDVRILCTIFLSESPASWQVLQQLLTQQLEISPYCRVSSGDITTPNSIYDTMRKYLGKREKDYPITLMYLFAPYLKNQHTVIAKLEEVLFWYTGKQEKFEGLLPGFGNWLELNQ